jgi:hypothetical protein
MNLIQILALVAFLCAAVLAGVGRAWPVSLIALGLAGWLVSTTAVLH